MIPYHGKRGMVWYLKYRDASGTQVKERLGRADRGWTRRKAEVELRARLSMAVAKEGYRRQEPVTFGSFAVPWLEEYADAKPLKFSTRCGYESILHRHLLSEFGKLALSDLDVTLIERFAVNKRRTGLSPATVNRILNVLSLVLRAAMKRGMIAVNSVAQVDRPKEEQTRWRIFTPAEVGAVERSFDALIAEAATDVDRDDFIVTRRLFLLHMGLGLRRGEAAGLRWRSVLLADPEGPMVRVEEAWVRHRTTTPKSRAGRRTISLGSRLADELWAHRQWSRFSGDDEYVFPNARTGRPLGENRYSDLVKRARNRAGIMEYVRPSHDLRHSSITNAAAVGVAPEALMSRSGHRYGTTRRYIDLAGIRFREEADRIEDRLWGKAGTKNRYQVPMQAPSGDVDDAGEWLENGEGGI